MLLRRSLQDTAPVGMAGPHLLFGGLGEVVAAALE